MYRRYYNLVLMVLWLLVAGVLLAPEGVVPDNLRRQLGGPLRLPVAVLAVVLAVYNFARWWAYQSLTGSPAARVVNPLAVRKPDAEAEPYEPNPELDFLQVPDADQPHPPPEPSANGDHKG